MEKILFISCKLEMISSNLEGQMLAKELRDVVKEMMNSPKVARSPMSYIFHGQENVPPYVPEVALPSQVMKPVKPSSTVVISTKPVDDESKIRYKVPYNEKRWTEENFHDNLEKLAFTKKFVDGTEKKVVSCTSVPRWVWPLNYDGKMYDKIQNLFEDFNYQCTRDDPSKPNMYVIMDFKKV